MDEQQRNIEEIINSKKDWINSFVEPRYPELAAPFRMAINAYERIISKNKIDPDDLKTITDIIRSPRIILWLNGTELLADLTIDYPEARNEVAILAKDPKARIRFNAVLSVIAGTPKEFGLEILKNALVDKSARVREKAADWAFRNCFWELLPELEQACETEENKTTRFTMEYCIGKMKEEVFR